MTDIIRLKVYIVVFIITAIMAIISSISLGIYIKRTIRKKVWGTQDNAMIIGVGNVGTVKNIVFTNTIAVISSYIAPFISGYEMFNLLIKFGYVG